MTITLYDLAAADPDVRFSPFCWRARMALIHKGLDYDAVPWRFTEKDAIAPSGQQTVPVIVDGDKWISDSWAIAEYLDEHYPDRPLFASEQAKSHIRFLKAWTETVLLPSILRQVIMPLFNSLDEKDKPYFRSTREARFGMTLEEFGADAEAQKAGFASLINPLRIVLKGQPYLGGQEPDFGDYIVFAAFQWAYYGASESLLAKDDPVYDWWQRLRKVAAG